MPCLDKRKQGEKIATIDNIWAFSYHYLKELDDNVTTDTDPQRMTACESKFNQNQKI